MKLYSHIQYSHTCNTHFNRCNLHMYHTHTHTHTYMHIYIYIYVYTKTHKPWFMGFWYIWYRPSPCGDTTFSSPVGPIDVGLPYLQSVGLLIQNAGHCLGWTGIWLVCTISSNSVISLMMARTLNSDAHRWHQKIYWAREAHVQYLNLVKLRYNEG